MKSIVRRMAGVRTEPASRVSVRRWALLGFAAVGAAFMAARLLYAAKPIADLSEGISRAMAGDFETKVDMPSVGTMCRPIREFNNMLDMLSRTESAQEDYLYGVSHEFKVPLAYIQQFATLLQDDALSEEDRAEYLSGIIAGTRRLSNMVSSMLELAIVNNFDGQLEKEAYSLDEQLRQALILFAPLMDQKKISYDADLVEATIHANKCLLDEVWANILSNAVKYTASGGSIHVNLKIEGGFAKVAIADTGCGMGEEALDQAFERFYRNEATAQEGVGLGLSIAKAIVEQHGGTIRLDSALNDGTTCSVTLPLRP